MAKKTDLAGESPALHRAHEKLAKQLEEEKKMLTSQKSLKGAIDRIHRQRKHSEETRLSLKDRTIQKSPSNKSIQHLLKNIVHHSSSTTSHKGSKQPSSSKKK